MSNEKMCASFRMLMLITTPKLGEKAFNQCAGFLRITCAV